MSKIIKVKELLNMEELPENIRINGINFKRTEFNMLEALYANNKNRWWTNSIELLLDNEVEIIEDEQEIDIQDKKELESIEDYEADPTDVKLNRQIINKLVHAVKQLDKKMKED